MYINGWYIVLGVIMLVAVAYAAYRRGYEEAVADSLEDEHGQVE